MYCSRRLLMGADKSKTQEVFIFKTLHSPNLFVPVAVLLDEPVSKRVECRVGVRVPRLHHALQADSWPIRTLLSISEWSENNIKRVCIFNRVVTAHLSAENFLKLKQSQLKSMFVALPNVLLDFKKITVCNQVKHSLVVKMLLLFARLSLPKRYIH
jgi:hypothetical protein